MPEQELVAYEDDVIEPEAVFGVERDGDAIRFSAVIPPVLAHDQEFRVETTVPCDVALDWLLNDLQVVLSSGVSVDAILAVERTVRQVKAAVLDGKAIKDVPASLQRNGELLRTELAMLRHDANLNTVLDTVLIQRGQSNDLSRALASLPPELELTEKRVHDYAVNASKLRQSIKLATVKMAQEFVSTVDLVGKTVAGRNGEPIKFRNEDELRGIITSNFASWFDAMSLCHAQDVAGMVNAKIQPITADHHHAITCAGIVTAAIGRCYEDRDTGMMLDDQEVEGIVEEFQQLYMSTTCRYLQRNGLRGMFIGGDAHGAVVSRLSGFVLDPHVEIVPIPAKG